jgi:hypothetical protein
MVPVTSPRFAPAADEPEQERPEDRRLELDVRRQLAQQGRRLLHE